jgi:hypothetical protein
MSELARPSNLATQTLAQIAEIDRRIASLVELRNGLKRVFVSVCKAGNEDLRIRDQLFTVSRRAMMEQLILEILENADGGPLRTRELFNRARMVSAHLNYATFRSYLHRLKRSGVIAPENTVYGSWKLCDSDPKASNQDDRVSRPRERSNP